ncbi:MAG: hypothetical protein ACF8PN_16095 [Phycisphaerales bacterium]
MMVKRSSVLPFIISLSLLIMLAGRVDADGRSPGSYLPDDALVALSVRNGDHAVTRLRDALLDLGWHDLEFAALLNENPELTQGRLALMGLAASAGTDSWGAVGAFLGRDAAAGLYLEDGQDEGSVLVAVRLRQPELVDRMLEGIQSFTGMKRRGEFDPDRVTLVNEIRVFAPTDELRYVRVDDTLLLASTAGLMNRAIASDDGHSSLENASWFVTATDSEASLISFSMQPARIRALIQAANGDDSLPLKLEDPTGGFLLGGLWHALLHAEAVSASVSVSEREWRFDSSIVTDEPLPATHRGFVVSDWIPAGWSAEKLPGFIGEQRLLRDWSALVAERESLITLEAASQVVDFTNTMTTLMGGLDYAEDYLPRISGPIRFIACEQSFEDESYTPSPQLPAFAMITPLRGVDDPTFKRRLYSATQTVFSIISLDQAQKGEPTMLLEVDIHDGERVVTTWYPEVEGEGMMGGGMASPTDGSKDAVGVQYNFAPSAAIVGSEYIVTTSTDLLRDIIDVVKSADESIEQRLEPITDSFTIEMDGVTSLLQANLTELITNRMLETDQGREMVDREIRAFIQALALVERMDFTTVHEDGVWRLSAGVRFASEPATPIESHPTDGEADQIP